MASFASDILFSIDTALQLKNGANEETISGTKTLTYKSSSIQLLAPSGGAQNCKLPPMKSGVFFWISNVDSTHNLYVELPGGSTTHALSPGGGGSSADSAALCVSDGVKWHVFRLDNVSYASGT